MRKELSQKEKRELDLSVKALSYARNSLFINLRFMEIALGNFKYKSTDFATFGSDGEVIFFNPRFILKRYSEFSETLTRDYLHVVLHCVFNHLFGGFTVNREVWDLACDIAVESVITELALPITRAPREAKQRRIIRDLQEELGLLTAERLYAYYIEKSLSSEEMEEIREVFLADEHFLWYTEIEADDADEEGTGSSKSKEKRKGGGSSQNEEEGGGSGERKRETKERNEEQSDRRKFERDNLVGRWKDVAERIQEDLNTFSKQKGDAAGNLIQNLKEVTREKYDYTSFLKKFATLHEAMKINDDEFDYVYYTYGLQLYDRMPLVEPLEYKDLKQIKDFVIAIDTSGSVSGKLVQSFLQKTYNILKNEESFFKKFNLHLIQCDAELQHDEKITSQEEFDNYIKDMTLFGFGGTDFRPVFNYVDELIKNKEFTNLKGLIYFTDGFGDFPASKPAYDVAFVFVQEDDMVPAIPPWAIKLVLRPSDIK